MMRLRHGLPVIILLLSASERADAADQSALCRPVEVMAWANRVHVRCELPVAPNIVYLAASAQPDVRFATRVVALAAVAQASQKTLVIRFDPADSTGPGFGCLAHDCRPLTAIGLTEQSPPTPRPGSGTPSSGTPGSDPIAQCVQACDDGRDTCESIAEGREDILACSRANLRCSDCCNPSRANTPSASGSSSKQPLVNCSHTFTACAGPLHEATGLAGWPQGRLTTTLT